MKCHDKRELKKRRIINKAEVFHLYVPGIKEWLWVIHKGSDNITAYVETQQQKKKLQPTLTWPRPVALRITLMSVECDGGFMNCVLHLKSTMLNMACV